MVTLFYLVAQMVGAGSLVALLLGTNSAEARTWTIVAVGGLMVVYVTVGGMRATTWIQIVKAFLLVAGSVLLTVLLLLRFHGDVAELMRQAAQHSGAGQRYLEPGLKYGKSFTSRLDFFSLGLALVLGTAGLPHILSRFYTVPTARAARRSTMWAIGLVGGFYLMAIALGSAPPRWSARRRSGTPTRRATPPSRCSPWCWAAATAPPAGWCCSR